jgi:hypothetical protein
VYLVVLAHEVGGDDRGGIRRGERGQRKGSKGARGETEKEGGGGGREKGGGRRRVYLVVLAHEVGGDEAGGTVDLGHLSRGENGVRMVLEW